MGKIHNSIDDRNIAIDNVGICQYKLPLTFQSVNKYDVVAEIESGVSLGKNVKGAHLSRIIETLDEFVAYKELDLCNLDIILKKLKHSLQTDNANLKLSFDIIVPSVTPVSNRLTYLNSNVILSAKIKGYQIKKSISLTATGAMLCPNSKTISRYGAHSQKCNLRATLCGKIEDIVIEDVIKILFGQFSAEVYGIVKSVDEKELTEKAYQNPKFSEDLIRDVLLKLKEYYSGGAVHAQLENLESIHQHNVYAKGSLK